MLTSFFFYEKEEEVERAFEVLESEESSFSELFGAGDLGVRGGINHGY